MVAYLKQTNIFKKTNMALGEEGSVQDERKGEEPDQKDHDGKENEGEEKQEE